MLANFVINYIFEGIVEVDECFIKESFKGNHSKSTTFVMPRNPRKRGKGKNDKKKRGISKEQICIETAIVMVELQQIK